MEMQAKAPFRGDVRDDIKKLTLIAEGPDEQRVLARFFKAFKQGDIATLQIVSADEPSELVHV